MQTEAKEHTVAAHLIYKFKMLNCAWTVSKAACKYCQNQTVNCEKDLCSGMN